MSSLPTLHVYFDDVEAQVVESKNKQLIVTVPDSLNARQSIVKVVMNNLVASSSDKFHLASFSINRFGPRVAVTGTTLTLTGNHFSPIAAHNKVTLGGIDAVVTEASLNKLEVTLPLQDKGIYPAREVRIQVEVVGEVLEYSDKILVNDRWFRIQDFPGTKTYHANCYVVNGKAYIGLNSTNQLWRFSPENHSWEKMADFPGVTREDGAGFHLNEKLYFGTGLTAERTNLKDFWEFDTNTNAWRQKNNFSGSARTGATGYSTSSKGYLTGGHTFTWFSYSHPSADNWQYDQAADAWRKAEDFDDLEWGGVDGLANGVAAVANGTAYYGLGWNYTSGDYKQRIYSFNPSEGTGWRRIQDFPVIRNSSSKAISFALNGKPYFKSQNSEFFQYNAATDSWSHVETNILADISGGIGFSIGGKAYVGLGNSKTLWEYDPSR